MIRSPVEAIPPRDGESTSRKRGRVMGAMKRIGLAMAVLGLAACPMRAARAGLIGTSVTGSLNFGGGGTNYFDPANGFVPAGFGNSSPGGPTVVISNAYAEFGFADGANTDTADFTNTTLSISDVSSSIAGTSSFRMTFTDTAFAGLVLTKISDTFPFSGGKITGSLSGTTITLDFNGAVGPFNGDAVFTLLAPDPAPVPEPATFGMAAVAGIAGLVAYRRRKRTA